MSPKSPNRFQVVLFAAAIVTVIVVLFGPSWGPFNMERFDSVKWISSPPWPNYKCTRAPMVDDLIGSHLKSGTPRATVRALIGNPDVPSDQCSEGNRSDCYWLGGPERGIMGYGEAAFLYIHYDDAGRVEKAWRSR